MIYTYQDVPVYIATGFPETGTGSFGVSDDFMNAQSVSISFDRSVEPKKVWGESGSYEYLHSGPMRGTIQINTFNGNPSSSSTAYQVKKYRSAVVKVGSLDFSGALLSYSAKISPWEAIIETWNIEFFSGGGTMEAGPQNVSPVAEFTMNRQASVGSVIWTQTKENLPTIIDRVNYSDTIQTVKRYSLGAVYPEWNIISHVKKVDATSDNITGLVTWSGETAALKLKDGWFDFQGAVAGDGDRSQNSVEVNLEKIVDISGYITSQSLSVSEQGLLEGSMTIEETLV